MRLYPLLVALLLSLLGPAFFAALHIYGMPSALRYMPTDSAVTIIVPSMSAAWTVLQPHIVQIDSGSECPKEGESSNEQETGENDQLAQQLQHIRCDLADKGISLQSLARLEEQGIDITRAVAIGFKNIPSLTSEPRGVLAIPITDEGAFRKTISKLRDMQSCELPIEEKQRDCMLITQDSYAILASDRRLLGSVLDWPWTTAAYWWGADSLAAMTSRLRPTEPSLAVVATAMILRPLPTVISLYGNRTTLGATFDMQPPIVSSHLTNFLERDLPAAPSDLDSRFPFLLRLSDPDLATYLDFANSFTPDTSDRVFSELKRTSVSYSALPELLKDSVSLSSFIVLIGDVRQGVPETSLVLSLSAADADNLVLRLQQDNIVRRNCGLVDAIRKSDGSEPGQCSVGGPPLRPKERAAISNGIQSLVGRGMLQTEGELVPIDPARPPREIPASTFATAAYWGCLQAACRDEQKYRFIGVPLTSNDFRWLLPDISPEDRKALEGNRFRLVSYYDVDKQRLWLSLDLEALRKALAQAAAPQPVNGSDAKVFLQFDPAWLWLHGRVSAGDDAKSFIKKYGRNLRNYRNGEVVATPLGPSRGVRIDVRLDN
jgi:hypothetical protein